MGGGEATDHCESSCLDADGDGHMAAGCGGDDCDDADADRFPGNAEVCDYEGHDEDCDPSSIGVKDVDRDGFVDSGCCNGTGPSAVCGEDCDDARRNTSPIASEACDGRDNDCDGNVDEEVLVSGFRDVDRDLHGDPGQPLQACAGAGGFSSTMDDCNDAEPLSHGAQPEVTDTIDNDCDGNVDESATPVTWYRDLDTDGFGDADSGSVVASSRPTGYSILATDCDDGDLARSPRASELCNGIDDDCNGQPDFRIGLNDYEDDDLDGVTDSGCPGGAGVDCDDRDPSTRPGAPERCDGRDNDCDSRTDESCSDVPEMDAGVPDDAGARDAGPRDAGPSDAGPSDAGPSDAGAPDGGTATDFSPRTIASYNASSCAVVSGRVVCWGENGSGQLGVAGTPVTAVEVTGAVGAVTVAVANTAACAVLANGTVVCWGTDTHELLGPAAIGSSGLRPPTAAVGISDAREIVGNWYNFCVRHATGAVSCWGDASYGVVPSADSQSPVAVPGLADAVEIEASDWSQVRFCARRAVGQVTCWGGGGAALVEDMGLTGVTALEAVGNGFCARVGAEWRCWGVNVPDAASGASRALAVPTVVFDYAAFEVLGGASSSSSTTFGGSDSAGSGSFRCAGQAIPAITTTSITAPGVHFAQLTSFGWRMICGVRAGTGTLQCVGDNSLNSLGTGGASSSAPVDVVLPF